jgi:GPH family glycoside/pentoside/hexuronide:cation symporter
MGQSPQAPELAAPKTSPQVPTAKRFLWGIGGMTDCLTYNGLNGMMDAIYINAMGLRPEIIGLARSIPRALDLLTDPVLGHLSDNTRSRWGRRRPWMAVGAVIAALIAVLMWFPPMHAATWVTTVFVAGMMVVLFTLGYSMFTIPYIAQGYELSTDYNERTHIFQWRQYAWSATGFLTPWLIPLCLWLEGDNANITRGAVGIHWVSLGVAALILLTAAAPIFGLRESGRHVAEKKTRFFDAIKFTLKNRAFWPLLTGNFLVKCGMAVTGCFFYYVMVYHVSGGDNKAGTAKLAIFFNSINLSTMVAMALMVRFTDRIGKKPAILLLMVLSSLTYASVWFTLRPQTAPWVLNVAGSLKSLWSFSLWQYAAEIWPALVTGVCIGIFTNSMPMIMNSMLADVCDVDELACGQQRQAFYGAVFVTCDKAAMALTMLVQGFLVAASGYSAKLAVQAPETISFWMKALLYTQPVGFLLGFVCILFYPITRAKALEVRARIDARHRSEGKQAATS